MAHYDWSLVGLMDSKLLTEKKRNHIFQLLCNQLIDFSYSAVDHHIIDQINIRQATLRAMRQSYAFLKTPTLKIIVDGVDAPIEHSVAQIKADRDVFVVSAASVIAKVVRDRMMLYYHQLYPHYRFDLHKGYPTLGHKQMIARYGLSPIHRRSYHYALPEGK